jgi:hypothetical protein
VHNGSFVYFCLCFILVYGLRNYGSFVYFCLWLEKLFGTQALLKLVDVKMNHSNSHSETIIRVINLALACMHYEATMYPKMLYPCSLGRCQLVFIVYNLNMNKSLNMLLQTS